MADFNQRKKAVLYYALGGPLNSAELSQAMAISLQNASTLLKNYHRMGLFRRTRIGRSYWYTIAVKGIKRLDYLVSHPRKKKPKCHDYTQLLPRINNPENFIEHPFTQQYTQPGETTRDRDPIMEVLGRNPRVRVQRTVDPG